MLTLLLGVAIMSFLPGDSDAALPGARSHTAGNGDVFLGGNYIELGLSKMGSFGSMGPAPAGFHPLDSQHPNRIGFVVDDDGWDVGNAPITGDFFLPGEPEERFVLGYYLGATQVLNRAAEAVGNAWATPITPLETVDASDLSGGLLKAVTTGITKDNIKLTQTVSFKVDDKFFWISVEIENLSSGTVTDVRYMRSVDPDQDHYGANGTFDTYNKVISNPAPPYSGNQAAMVASYGPNSFVPFLFVSYDERARVSVLSSLYSDSLWSPSIWAENMGGPTVPTDSNLAFTSEMLGAGNLNGFVRADVGIAITFAFGDLAPGDKVSLEMAASLDSDPQETINVVSDTVEPTVSPDVITVSNIKHDSLRLSWNKATDNKTLQSDLIYYVYTSANDDIDTVGDCLQRGTLLNPGGTVDISTMLSGGLLPLTTYYYNVVVADEAGNMAAYASVGATTLAQGSDSPRYTVTLVPGDGYTFTPLSKMNVVQKGGSYPFSISVDAGYNPSTLVVKVNGTAIAMTNGASYTIYNITRDTVITAEVSPFAHRVILPDGTEYTIFPESSTQVDHGGSFSFTIKSVREDGGTPIVKVDGIVLEQTGGKYVITDITGDVVVTIETEDDGGADIVLIIVIVVIGLAVIIAVVYFIFFRKGA